MGAADVSIRGGVSRANMPSFIAQIISAPVEGIRLPNIAIPDGFSLSIRSNIRNTGDIFIANSLENVIDEEVPGNRNTLDIGDTIKLFIANAKLVFIAGSESGQNVDILVEQQ